MILNKNLKLLETLHAIDTADTTAETISIYMEYAAQFGLNHFLISQIINPVSEHAQYAMMHSNWPEPILTDRFAGMNLLHDPVVQYGLRSRFPFRWEAAYRHASKYGKRLMDTARDFDIDNGITYPMRRPGAPMGGISLGGENIELPDEDKSLLELASLHCYSRLEALHPPFPADDIKSLSPQELDVLQFSTNGKTAWEISVILSISEAGVKDALKRARAKLNAVSTLHACTKAISRDLILP